MPHRIRLRGPWEFDSATNCFTRRFHQPTGLSPTTRVWLVLNEVSTGEANSDEAGADEANPLARIELNGQTVGQAIPGRSARFDITAFIKPQNLLSITLPHPPAQVKASPDGPLSLVSLKLVSLKLVSLKLVSLEIEETSA
jgi:hypothetical protein